MDFLGVGPLELIFILVIALIVIGPRDLGKTAHAIGRFLNRLYKSENWRMLVETSRTLRNLPQRLAREAALEELDLTRQATMDELNAAQKALSEAGQEISTEVRSIEDEIQNSKTVPYQEATSVDEDPGEDQSPLPSDGHDEQTTHP
jgi:sec-independent protein translocase protein TatB